MSEENERLYEEAQRRLREVTTLYEASQACFQRKREGKCHDHKDKLGHFEDHSYVIDNANIYLFQGFYGG